MKSFVNKTLTINISEHEDNRCHVTGHEPNRWWSQPTGGSRAHENTTGLNFMKNMARNSFTFIFTKVR